MQLEHSSDERNEYFRKEERFHSLMWSFVTLHYLITYLYSCVSPEGNVIG